MSQLITQSNHIGSTSQKLYRPLIAVIKEDFLKIKDIKEKKDFNNLIEYLTGILNIKVSSEQEKSDLNTQMLIVLDFIKSKFKEMTTEEVKEAFKMYVAKQFPEIKVFRILDCIVVGDVLSSYIEFRNENLRVYDQKKQLQLETRAEKTKEEIEQSLIDFLKIVFESLRNNIFYENSNILYKKLEEKGKINLSKDEKISLYKSELEFFLNEKKEDVKYTRCQKAKNILNQFKVGNTSKIQNIVSERCKSIVVNDYLKNYLTDFETFKKQIIN